MKPQTHTTETASAQPDIVRIAVSRDLTPDYEHEALKDQLRQVTAQRDELLAACKEMNAATLAGGPYDIDKASVRIRAAISKATKP